MLKNPVTQECRYVGKTVQTLKRRLKDHISFAKSKRKKSHCQNWILSLLSQNIKPEIELIEICDDSVWEERERYWIKTLNNLTNIAEGGFSRHGYTLTEEHKRNIGLGNLGLKRSEETKQLLSLTHKGIPVSESAKQKIREALVGRIRPQEVRDKISKSHIGKVISEKTKEKLRVINLGKKHIMEHRIKVTSRTVLQIDINTGQVVERFPTLGYVTEKYPDLWRGNVSSACTGRLKTYRGYMWKYESEDIV